MPLDFAIQLATALAVKDSLSAEDIPSPTFAADENLISAARTEGMAAENPNDPR